VLKKRTFENIGTYLIIGMDSLNRLFSIGKDRIALSDKANDKYQSLLSSLNYKAD